MKPLSSCSRRFPSDTEIDMEQPIPTRIAVVIPCYKVTRHILDVIACIPHLVGRIYVVDDACPDRSGRLVEDNCRDHRVQVLYHEVNQGVGGAVLTGYAAAIHEAMEVIVKVDGDGQMDPALIPMFVRPIVNGEADYTKGNRFFDLEVVHTMPRVRLLGNAALSFMTKFSSGYWNLFDPTNGYTAVHIDVARHLPLSKISRRYFFETDMLFRLNVLRAVVVEIPMAAKYADEVSNLKISKVAGEFALKHCRGFFKRIFYNYYLRNMSLASLELPFGIALIFFGVVFGGYQWVASAKDGVTTSAGTVMIAALPFLMGIQLVLAFLGHDIASVPTQPIWKHLRRPSIQKELG